MLQRLFFTLICTSVIYNSGAFESHENESVVVKFKPHELKLEINDVKEFKIVITSTFSEPIFLNLIENKKNIINLPIKNFTLNASRDICLQSINAGHVSVVGVAKNSTVFDVNTENAFINIDVCRSLSLDIVSIVIGWIYFAAWTLSFYPQLWENYKRKSVIGLNFDFLVLNFVGHTCYDIFNAGLFWIPLIEKQYFEKYPRSHLNPIQINDIAFSMHAVFATFVTILQTFIYERGDQSVSKTCKAILAIIFVFLLISLILSICNVIVWLEYLYFISYVKLAITLIKYCPQAYFNYRRKSTVGWSIGNVLMDFTGGFFSILQMFVIAYNYSDWFSMFGDPTKFGLGFFSILFDILFMIQHYILYRKSDETKHLISTDSPTSTYSSSESLVIET